MLELPLTRRWKAFFSTWNLRFFDRLSGDTPFWLVASAYLLATLPLFFYLESIDYDTGSLKQLGVQLLKGQGTGYTPPRHPGSPVYELISVWIFYWIQKAGGSLRIWEYTMQVLSWGLGFGVLVLFYRDLKRAVGPVRSAWATLALAVHPIFIWPAFSFADDLPALFLGYLSFHLVLRRQNPFWAATWMAMALNCKGLALGFFMGAVIFLWIDRDWPRLRAYVGMALGLGFLFYLPALAAFGMDLRQAMTTDHYGSDPALRPWIAWDLWRRTVLWHLPLLVWIAVDFVRRKRKQGLPRRSLIATWQPIDGLQLGWLLLSAAGLVTFRRFYFLDLGLLALAVSGAWILKQKMAVPVLVSAKMRTPLSQPQEWAPWFVLFLFVFWINLQAPYSRSFFLPLLLPLFYFLATRVPTRWFWIAGIGLTYLPMWFYFEVTAKAPVLQVWNQGFYWALKEHKNRHFNDFGFWDEPPVFQLRQPPAK